MATAKNNTKTALVPAKEVTTGTVDLILEILEARFLRQVLDAVGGSPHRSARKHSQAITSALDEAGVQRGRYLVKERTTGHSASIYFEDQLEVIRGES